MADSVRAFRLVVQAVLVLAEAPRGMATSAEIARAVGAHAVEVRCLLGLLRDEGIVESRRGPQGGWAVARDPATIPLGRLYRILAREVGAVTPVALDDILERARAAYAAELDGVMLTDLLQDRPDL